MFEYVQVWHEINNSLTAVNLTLEFLEKNSVEISASQLKAELVFSLQSLAHVRKVIHSVGERSEVEECDLSQLVQRVISTLSRKWPNVEVEVEEKSPHLEVYGSKTAMIQVFMNLITNAIESYENKALNRKLKVRIILKRTSSSQAEIAIQDWGRGVPELAKENIFDKFYTLKKETGGTGIGLALCKEIIEEQFGGSISFKSQVGRGSVFKVVLPIGAEVATLQNNI